MLIQVFSLDTGTKLCSVFTEYLPVSKLLSFGIIEFSKSRQNESRKIFRNHYLLNMTTVK